MKQSIGYKPNSNIITSMSVKQRDQDDYFQMRKDCQRYKWSQNDVQMLGYRELLKGAPPQVWRELKGSR